MKTTRIVSLAILTIGIALFSACHKDVTDVTLDKTELCLAEGYSEKLTATVHPDNATNKDVSWRSSNPAIASVNENGLVTAIKDGEATITVTTKDGGKSAACDVIVDYRGKWTGDWNFTVSREGNTFYHSGSIRLRKNDNNYPLLKVDYLEHEYIMIDVYTEDGWFSIRDGNSGSMTSWGGFDGLDEMHAYHKTTRTTINGTRKKGDKKE
ncbi:Ig-like domain-containing protein [Bacteroidales bacterium OttesenSCG-928-C03]|nr:Ig-like domain-containing protein [Bacteroidales bacterium OttesenSCG-928-C03]